jgi:adenine phosphoribosyltransferase
VLIVDDVLATGGTARAVRGLVDQLQGEIVGLAFLLELRDLNGRNGLDGVRIESVLQY